MQLELLRDQLGACGAGTHQPTVGTLSRSVGTSSSKNGTFHTAGAPSSYWTHHWPLTSLTSRRY